VAAVGAVWWTLSDRQPRYLMAALVYAAPLAAAAIASTSGRGRRFLETLAAAAAMTMLVVVVTREAADAGGTIRARRFTRSAFYGYPAAVDALGPTAVVVNLIDRPDNYALFGERLAARVVNSRRAFRELGASARGGPPREVALRPEALRALGATHLCASEETTLRTPSGVRLTAVGGSGRPGRRLVLWRLDFLPAAPDPSIR
jgi:hypothetical protein